MANDSHPAPTISQLGDRFVAAVQAVVLVVCIAFWFVVGFTFWLPLLARTVAVYCGGMVAAAIADVDIPQLKRLLDSAVEFYPKGFRRIFEHHRGLTFRDPASTITRIDWRRVGWEIVWTVAFWLVLLAPLWARSFLRTR